MVENLKIAYRENVENTTTFRKNFSSWRNAF